ncbi:olfactory receptor 14L1-like [Ochotona princeps]|uniref:olfactory receptor 14L1-like n=1 Tax=Ochotona princeps TaxID=9978 RepID=UPI0027150FCC|nr:olfactory receptor 14L1-like [Ochotona princeps]
MPVSVVWWQQTACGTLFLLILLAAVFGNLLIITVATLDQRLHSPMYFFLKHLSFLDLWYILVTLPKATVDSLTGSTSISFWGCVLQVFLVVALACTEMALLTVMSYDRYVAICLPLHYEVIMSRGSCVSMVTCCWLSGGLSGVLHAATTFSLPLTASGELHQFFCEIPQLLRLSCSDDYLAEVGAVAVTSSLSFICFLSITLSYVHIFSAVVRIPSVKGQSRAFATCIPHLATVTLFLGGAAMAYLKPVEEVPSAFSLLVSLFYTVVPPTLNPLIYSLRNKDMKAAVKKCIQITSLDSLSSG